MHPEGIGINAGNWIDSILDRDYWRAVSAALNFRVPQAIELDIFVFGLNNIVNFLI